MHNFYSLLNKPILKDIYVYTHSILTHRLHLCGGVSLPATSVLDMTLNDLFAKLHPWRFYE